LAPQRAADDSKAKSPSGTGRAPAADGNETSSPAFPGIPQLTKSKRLFMDIASWQGVNALRTKSQEALDRAEAQFKKKENQARASEAAMAEYNLVLRNVREKTARLKALRLAREAADAAQVAEQ
jgi:hypothetical protein